MQYNYSYILYVRICRLLLVYSKHDYVCIYTYVYIRIYIRTYLIWE